MRPVFIGGCDRSGTTMLGAMLGAHSRCICIPEAQFIIDLINSPAIRPAAGREKIDLMVAKRLVAEHPRFRLWGMDLDLSSAEQSGDPLETYAQLIAWIVKQYAKKQEKTIPDIWIDHTPWNTRYAASLFDLFPQAKMIHIVRDGRAVAASIMPLRWGPKTIDQAAYFWLRNLSFGLAAEQCYRDRVQRIMYEDLVTQPAESLEKLCAFIGLEYQPGMVHADGFQAPMITAKEHALVGKPPDASRVAAWRTDLGARQVEIFEHICGDMLRYLGYQPIFDGVKRPMNTVEKIESKLGIVSMYVGNLSQNIWMRRTGAKKARQRNNG